MGIQEDEEVKDVEAKEKQDSGRGTTEDGSTKGG